METALQQLSNSDLISLIKTERAEQLQAIESERAERIKHEKQVTQY